MKSHLVSNKLAHLRPLTYKAFASNVQKERVLIVDRERPVRMLLTRLLKPWGYRTMHVGSVVDALTVMRLEPAEILICDVDMPEEDGVWLVEQVRARWPQTRVITSTWHQDAHARQMSRQLGAKAYITKPLIPQMLHQALALLASAETLH
jgi:CheY-like chemotaxis protein